MHVEAGHRPIRSTSFRAIVLRCRRAHDGGIGSSVRCDPGKNGVWHSETTMLGVEDRVLEEERERLDLQRFRIEGILADEAISEEMELHLRRQLGQIYLRLWSLGVSIESWPGAVTW